METEETDRRADFQRVRDGLRELRVQLMRLNHQVGTRVELRDVDLDCFDLIAQHRSTTPSALAAAMGLHPATLTGVIDRLERGGWIVRTRADSDRRSVTLQPAPRSAGRLVPQFQGMSDAMDAVCADYSHAELRLIIDFLGRAARAGGESAQALSER